jgi:F0F1-type ATP synthase assembly protein I
MNMIFTRQNAGYIAVFALMGVTIGWLLAKMAEQSISGTLIRMLIGMVVVVGAFLVSVHLFIARHRTACPECGSEVQKDQGKCQNCGHELSEEERS